LIELVDAFIRPGDEQDFKPASMGFLEQLGQSSFQR
jgi:hypothetical protein